MPRVKSDTLTIYAAIRRRDGRVLTSSVSAFYSVALRWTHKYPNYEVKQLCVLSKASLKPKTMTPREMAEEVYPESKPKLLPAPKKEENNVPKNGVAPARRKIAAQKNKVQAH